MTIIRVFAGPFIQCRIWKAGTGISKYRNIEGSASANPLSQPSFISHPPDGAQVTSWPATVSGICWSCRENAAHALAMLSAPLCVAKDSATVGVGEPLRAEVAPQQTQVGSRFSLWRGGEGHCEMDSEKIMDKSMDRLGGFVMGSGPKPPTQGTRARAMARPMPVTNPGTNCETSRRKSWVWKPVTLLAFVCLLPTALGGDISCQGIRYIYFNKGLDTSDIPRSPQQGETSWWLECFFFGPKMVLSPDNTAWDDLELRYLVSRPDRYLPYLTKNGDYGNEPTAWDIVVFLWAGSPDRIDETSSPLDRALWNHVQLWILASWGSSTLKGAKLKSNWDLHSASWEEILVGQNTSLKIIQHICVNTFWPTEIGVPISISSLYTNSSPLWSTFAGEIQLHKY